MTNLKKIAAKNILWLLELFTKKMGYQVVLLRTHRDNTSYSENNCYERVVPHATYAPWLADTSFRAVYDIIKDYSWVDEFRCYELWQLVAESKKLNGAILEVGAWRGGTGGLIAKKAEIEGIQDTIYICDTFAGVVKAGIHDSRHSGGEYADTSKEIVEDLIEQKLHLSKVIILEGIFPEETAHLITVDQFRFCHIDVDVYQSAKEIIEWIWPRMSVNGIIVYDDYGFSGASGITKFVNEERKKTDRIVIHNLNGHAIIVKLDRHANLFPAVPIGN